jgi:CRISPR-associated endonuclease/helicase Cas3
MPWYAHSREGRPESEWELLTEHQTKVSVKAGAFAEQAFGDPLWGRAAGWQHDAGKASAEFLERLRGRSERVDHSTGGARDAVARYGRLGRLLAYVIAGHHGSLPDADELDDRLRNPAVPTHDPAAAEGAPDTLALPLPVTDILTPSFFVRMLFSCLADADFLETERFYDVEGRKRRGIAFDPEALQTAFERHLATLPAGMLSPLRQEILECCRAMADRPRGFFSLTVPTGGGKTLSSLAFALAHARHHIMRRIVYVIPYTSIIEQNAAIFRTALGPAAILEHHSNFRHPTEPADEDDVAKLKHAEENWDAPVVVTTSVQFFESLYASRPARARKLHNLAGAVIILDEAQLLPLPYLGPCLAALKALVRDYGATVMLCTATQPALGDPAWLPTHALDNVTEIMAAPKELHKRLRRVEIIRAGTLTDRQVAERMAQSPQALTVVNTRDHARALFDAIAPLPGATHLSARQCPAHRKALLETIRADLKAGNPVRLISTQLIEAGVDVDFPLVLRALAGLDSIIQSAGRCNREAKAKLGQVLVFEPADRPIPRNWVNHANLTERVLTDFTDPMSPEAVMWYFQNLYQSADLDEKGILKLLTRGAKRADFLFRTAADNFRLIEETGLDVVVPWDDEARAALAKLDPKHPWRHLRALQPYVIRLPRREAEALRVQGALTEVTERVRVVDRARYDDKLGLQPSGAGEEVW